MSTVNSDSNANLHWPEDSIFWSKVARSQTATLGQKFVDGLELFDDMVVWMKAGIRHQFPHYKIEEVHSEFLRRLQIARQLDDSDAYAPVDDVNE